MQWKTFLLLIIISCSKVEVQKNTCIAKFKKIEALNFSEISERELVSHDNDIRLVSLDYGKSHFRTLKELEQNDFSCFASSLISFSFSKAVLNEITHYPVPRQEKMIKDLKRYIKFRVDAKDNTLEHNQYIFGLLRKISRQGFFPRSKNRIILKMRELADKWDKIKGIQDKQRAKLQEDILYQVSRGHILKILERG